MTLRHFLRWLAAGASLAMAACGGGGSSGGIGGTGNEPGVAYGTITNFGSVWVNGVEYSTSNTKFKTDDHPTTGGTQGDLRIGMVVRVDGSITNKTATTITEDSSIKGLVEQVVGTDRFVVMGQSVQTDATTRFENGIRPLQGERVEVHGLIAGDGVYSAGFIERKTTVPSPAFVVKGIVKNQNAASQTFQIGTLTVQYGGATPGDLPLTGSWNGLQVEAKGESCAGPTPPACGTLVATQLSLAGAQSLKDGTQAEIEGVVVALAADGFTIGNQRVVTTTATRYEGGVLADLLVGTQVEVEGTISGGVLAATKVSFHDGLRVEGDVANVNGNTLTIAGLGGFTVSLTSFTELKDVTGPLVAGNHLRVRGKLGVGNTLIATRLELRSARSDVELQAAVQAASPESSLRLLGVDIATDSGISYRDASGSNIGRTAFFAAATVNKLVKAKGTLAGGSVTWTELELEN